MIILKYFILNNVYLFKKILMTSLTFLVTTFKEKLYFYLKKYYVILGRIILYLLHVYIQCPRAIFNCLVVGGSQEVTVTFAPDHISDHFSDGVHIELFGEVGTRVSLTPPLCTREQYWLHQFQFPLAGCVVEMVKLNSIIQSEHCYSRICMFSFNQS